MDNNQGMEGINAPEEEMDEQSPDKDDRQATQNLLVAEADIFIDELSPDEDDRWAMQSLRVPERTSKHIHVILSGASY